ncbi:hypothetical protein ACA910_008550 [Epithemia clementina (nom. ined.)]
MLKSESRVTYLETLHPETGAEALSRNREAYPGHWAAVWAEAVLIDEDTHQPPPQPQEERNAPVSVESGDNDDKTEQKVQSCPTYNVGVLIFGWSLLIAAVSATFGMELFGSICFVLAAGFNWVYRMLGEAGGLAVIVQSIFGLMYLTLSFVDSLLLVIGTLVTELLAWVVFVLCSLFGGLSAGSEWHQSTRRLCHLTRWAFRGFHEEWDCRRGFIPPAKPSDGSACMSTASSTNTTQRDNTTQPEDGIIVVTSAEVVIEVEPESVNIEQSHSDSKH